MANVLFVCSRNRLRSPTAEQVFACYPGVEVTSAGMSSDADNPLTVELVEWADLIFVMEKAHRRRLQAKHRSALRSARIVCLDIPDNYAFMDQRLVQLLHAKVPRHLPA
jgi:predicted protein tyrosine phosphatase